MRPLRYWAGWAALGILIVGLSAPTTAGVSAAPMWPAADTGATTAPYTIADELAALVDQLLMRQLAEAHIPGASVALVQDGRLLLAQGYGYANLERRTPVVADQTLFRVGSVAKLFTWTAVLQLVEQGRLDLTADVNTYLTTFQIPATYPEPITLAHLMTHTAGFEDRQLGITAATAEELVPLDVYLAAAMPARIAPPGTVTAYSNYGTALAGHLVERVSGEPFVQYVQRHILAPLGMEHSSFAQPLPPELAGRLAVSYRYDTAYHAMPFEYFQIAPAAALSATATDMARFLLAQLQDGRVGPTRILTPESVQSMHRRQFANHPHVNGMTYGFAEMTLNGQRLLVHSGSTNDERFRSLLALLPEQELGMFVTYSGEGGGDAKWELLQAVVDQLAPAARPGGSTPPADARARNERYVGTYRSTRSAVTTLEKIGALLAPAVSVDADADGYLTVRGLSRAPTRWVELEPLVFRRIDGDERIAFRADPRGRITHLFQGNLAIVGFQRLAWYEAPALHYAILAGGVVLFLTTLVGASFGWLHRRRRGAPATRLPVVARGLAWLVSALYLLFLVLFVVSMGDLTRFPTALTLVALSLALVAALGSCAGVVCATLIWMQRPWGIVRRVGYSLFALGALAFAWCLSYWNLLGFWL